MRVGFFSLGRALSQERSPADHLRRLVTLARAVEAAGFDEFALGENHARPFVLSSPIVVLSHIAATTSTIELGTAASLITVNDPVRLAEDLATLQNLAGPRVSITLGRGTNQNVYGWFGYDVNDSLELGREKYALFRRLWSEEGVTWTGKFRPALEDFTSLPRPLASPSIWHASPRSRDVIDYAAHYGDGFFANYTGSRPEDVVEQVEYYRGRYRAAGHADAPRVGSGAKVFVRRRSQDAVAEFESYLRGSSRDKLKDVHELSATTALTVGSPEQVLDKLGRFHELFGGIDRQLFTIDDGAFPLPVLLDQVELLASDVLPHLRPADASDADAGAAPEFVTAAAAGPDAAL